MTSLYNGNKVEIQSYYHPTEIFDLKNFIVDNLQFVLEQKLSTINAKIQELKHRRR